MFYAVLAIWKYTLLEQIKRPYAETLLGHTSVQTHFICDESKTESLALFNPVV